LGQDVTDLPVFKTLQTEPRPHSFAEFAERILYIDDDYYGDGDYTNGSPHCGVIGSSMRRHEIPVPPHPVYITDGPSVATSSDGKRYENTSYNTTVTATGWALTYSWSVADARYVSSATGEVIDPGYSAPEGTITGSGASVIYTAPSYPKQNDNPPDPDLPLIQNRIYVTIHSNYDGTTDWDESAWFTIYRGSPPSSGCPFLSTYNGSKFVEDNNILPTSELYPDEDITDSYLLEKPPAESENRYKLKIIEYENEHTFLDKVKLIAVDHPEDVVVLPTQDGDVVAMDNSQPPVTCFDKYGVDQTPLVKELDGECYTADKNSRIVSVFAGTIEGTKIVDVTVAVKSLPRLYTIGDGGWEPHSPIASRKNYSRSGIVLPEATDSVMIKFNDNNKVDYISLGVVDSGSMKQMIQKKCPLVSAYHSRLGLVKQKLLIDDQNYAQLLPGDTITLEFTAVDIEPGWVRDFVFVSDGYYITETGGGAQTAYSNIPMIHSLSIFPNPVRNDMTIRFGIPREEKVSLKVYDVSGREIKTLVDGRLEAGYHIIRLDNRNLPSGIYFARIETDNYRVTKKLVLMK
jgi:hypothetical protein